MILTLNLLNNCRKKKINDLLKQINLTLEESTDIILLMLFIKTLMIEWDLLITTELKDWFQIHSKKKWEDKNLSDNSNFFMLNFKTQVEPVNQQMELSRTSKELRLRCFQDEVWTILSYLQSDEWTEKYVAESVWDFYSVFSLQSWSWSSSLLNKLWFWDEKKESMFDWRSWSSKDSTANYELVNSIIINFNISHFLININLINNLFRK